MLIFLPQIYEDEILYGIISRYHCLSGNLNYKDTINEFFDSDTVIPTMSFPGLLDNIVAKIPLCLNYDSNLFINRYTLFPVYNPFLPDKRRKMIISEMKYHNGSKISNLLGVQAGHILEIKKLKYCPLCSIDDHNRNDVVYYHRIHQIEGVFVCSKHKCLTKEYKPNGDASRLEFVRMEYEKLDLNVEYEKDNSLEKCYINIAKSYEYLLTNDLYSFNNEVVHDRYIKYLDQMGLVTTSNRVKQKDLAIQFTM
ncbi:TniQ family protein, partial [Sedimentibacter sp.]|uniref:TniQ family protein n=1 Tax=Sedimentibacter sp. TaxID=1960295 RepID=UPI002896D77B